MKSEWSGALWLSGLLLLAASGVACDVNVLIAEPGDASTASIVDLAEPQSDLSALACEACSSDLGLDLANQPIGGALDLHTKD